MKTCPMCGEPMRVVTREVITRIPGTSQIIQTPVQEWVCRECDYFEEVDETTRDE